MTGFDPTDWLARFEAAGGWYVERGGQVSFGWRVGDDAQCMLARAIWREVETSPEHRELVCNVLRDRSAVA